MKASLICGVCQLPKELGKDCKPCARRRNAEYKKRNADRVRAARSAYKKAKWAATTAERAAKREARASTLKERRTASKRKWKEKNPHKVNAATAKRFASKLMATPDWADQRAIEQVYMLARFMTESTGILWHVDHVVPLKGRSACGLHVEHNLTFIPAAWNIAKGNRFNDWK